MKKVILTAAVLASAVAAQAATYSGESKNASSASGASLEGSATISVDAVVDVSQAVAWVPASASRQSGLLSTGKAEEMTVSKIGKFLFVTASGEVISATFQDLSALAQDPSATSTKSANSETASSTQTGEASTITKQEAEKIVANAKAHYEKQYQTNVNVVRDAAGNIASVSGNVVLMGYRDGVAYATALKIGSSTASGDSSTAFSEGDLQGVISAPVNSAKLTSAESGAAYDKTAQRRAGLKATGTN